MPMVSQSVFSPDALRLDADGAEVYRAALDPAVLGELLNTLGDQPEGQAGVRLFGLTGLDVFLGPTGVVGALAASVMPATPRAVRAILFDKTSTANWSLAWHQDRVIAVSERIDVVGFGPWTRKQGALHVAPPFDILADMRTLRIHLDSVTETNAPLLVAPGSHTLGPIAEPDVTQVVKTHGVATCLAEAGDIWIYATPILHASERAIGPTRRRVVQVDYAVGELPGGLRWLGV